MREYDNIDYEGRTRLFTGVHPTRATVYHGDEMCYRLRRNTGVATAVTAEYVLGRATSPHLGCHHCSINIVELARMAIKHEGLDPDEIRVHEVRSKMGLYQ